MAYVSVQNDLSKVKTKIAFNLTQRQLICFGVAAVIGIPSYLFTRTAIGNTGAMLLMIALMLPCFFFAMYERDGLPFEKVVRNIVRSKFLRPRTRPYQTQNFYAYLSHPAKEVPQHDAKTNRPPVPAKSGRRKRRGPQSAQQTIPYKEMFRDGICKVREGYYTKTLSYEDINYAVASSDAQSAIFDGYCAFLNYFDSALPFQLSFINHRSRPENRYSVNIPPQDDDFNSIRSEFTSMLEHQIARSNNGIVRSKYLTFGTHADGIGTARPAFAALIAEAEKYLGYPYVWGGSSPDTSFDCSGFVSYVLNQSGVYPMSRTTAQGIFNRTAKIPRSEAKPGDLIFFTGTYDSSGPVSHLGIYVGENMMLHSASGGVQYARTDRHLSLE